LAEQEQNFAGQRAQRQEDFKKQQADARENFAREASERQVELKERLAEQKEQFEKERGQRTEEYRKRFGELDDQYRKEVTKRRTAFADQLRDLDASLLGEQTTRLQYYAAMSNDLLDWLDQFEGQLQSGLPSYTPPVGGTVPALPPPPLPLGGRKPGGYLNQDAIFRGGEEGYEYVLSHPTTIKLERATGAPLTQESILNAIDNSRREGGYVGDRMLSSMTTINEMMASERPAEYREGGYVDRQPGREGVPSVVSPRVSVDFGKLPSYQQGGPAREEVAILHRGEFVLTRATTSRLEQQIGNRLMQQNIVAKRYGEGGYADRPIDREADILIPRVSIDLNGLPSYQAGGYIGGKDHIASSMMTIIRSSQSHDRNERVVLPMLPPYQAGGYVGRETSIPAMNGGSWRSAPSINVSIEQTINGGKDFDVGQFRKVSYDVTLEVMDDVIERLKRL